jgi:hypothetical protein
VNTTFIDRVGAEEVLHSMLDARCWMLEELMADGRWQIADGRKMHRCAALSIVRQRPPASSIEHPASSIEHPASSIQHPASSIY